MYAAVRAPRFYKRKRNPAPFIIAVVLVLLLGCWIFNLTCKQEETVSNTEYVEYMEAVTPWIEQSNDLNARREALVDDLASTDVRPGQDGHGA